MYTGFYMAMTVIKAAIIIVGIVLILTNIIKEARGKSLSGYSKAFKVLLSIFGAIALLTVLEFALA